ncbi:MAG TPA: hypothetical protein VIL55_10320 [Naasia sp.]
MDVGSLTLRYVPFLAMMGVALLVVLDARVRLKRPGGARWASALQLLLSLVMLVTAMVAIIVSPDVGLLDAAADRPTLETTVLAFAVVAVIALSTLLAGLAWPARPHPRRGLTVVALVADAAAIVLSGGTAMAALAMLG